MCNVYIEDLFEYHYEAHSELLELSANIFLSCGMANMSYARNTNPVWGLFEDPDLVRFAECFLSHNIKLLSIFVHIVEEREPEVRDKVWYSSL